MKRNINFQPKLKNVVRQWEKSKTWEGGAHQTIGNIFVPDNFIKNVYANKVIEYNSAHRFRSIQFSCMTNWNGDMKKYMYIVGYTWRAG